MNRFFTIFASFGLAAFLAVASCSKQPGEAEYDRGLYELKRDNAVRARALLEKSIARRPGHEANALAYNYLGVALWKLGQFQAAQEAFEDSCRLSPTLSEPLYNRALLLRQGGDDAQAAQLLEQAARANEKDPRPLETLAQMHLERQQWPQARRILHAALNRAPNSARILSALAVTDLHMVGPEKGIESSLIALEKDARFAPALFNIGLIYETRRRDPARAAAYFKRFLAQKPTGPAAEYARAALARPLPEPAETETPAPTVESPVAAPAPPPPEAPPAPQTPEQVEEDLIQRATQRAERGDAAGASDELLRAAAEAGKAGRRPAQEKLLRAATRIAIDQAAPHTALGDFLMERQQPDAALRAYKQAAMLDAQSFAAQLGLARAAMKTGEHDAALVGFTAAARIDPRNADALWDLAQLLDRQIQNPDRAIAAYREFEKLFPSDPRTRRATERIRALTPAARAATPPPERRPAPEPQHIEPAPTPAPTLPPAPPRTPIERTPVEPPRTPAPFTPPARQLNLRTQGVRNTAAARAAFNQGTQLLNQRRWEQAIAAFTRAAENDDRLTAAFYNLGLAYTQAGDYELAKSAYIRALGLQSDLHSARFNLALLYFQTRDLASATALAQELVRQKPDYAVAHYLLGQIYSSRAETLPQARSAYSRFIELAPNDPAAGVVRQWLQTH